MVKKILFLVLLSFLLMPAGVMAQTEWPINVRLDYEGTPPEGVEYTFRFVDRGSEYNNYEGKIESPECITCTAPETFTLKPGETKEIGKLVLDLNAVEFQDGSHYSYSYSIYQEDCSNSDKAGVFLDPCENKQTVMANLYHDASKCTMGMEDFYDHKTSSHPALGDTDYHNDTMVFCNRYKNPESSELEIRVCDFRSDLGSSFPCKICFWNDDGIINEDFPMSGAEDKQTIKSGDTYSFQNGMTYVVSGLPAGARYTLCYADRNYEAVLVNSSGTIPNITYIDSSYLLNTNFNSLANGSHMNMSQEVFNANEMEEGALYRIRYAPRGAISGSPEEGELFILGESKIIPFPLLRNPRYLGYETVEYGEGPVYGMEEWEVTAEPVFPESARPCLVYSAKATTYFHVAVEGTDPPQTETASELIYSGNGVAGTKNENGLTPESTYSFKFTPKSAEVKKAKSFEADPDKIKVLLSKEAGADGIKITESPAPPETDKEDVSLSYDESVSAWMDGTVFVISTETPGKKVVCRNFDLYELCQGRSSKKPSIQTMDVSALKPVGRLSFHSFSGAEIVGLGDLDTSEVTDMVSLFDYCPKLTSVEGINSWDTSNVTSLNYAFRSCDSLDHISIPNWDVSAVGDFSWCFDSCDAIEIDLSYWNTASAKKVTCMFEHCYNLEKIYAQSWPKVQELNESGMFDYSDQLPGYSYSKISSDYCKSISEGGYFSDPKGSPEVDRNPVYVPEPSKTPKTLTAEDMPVPSLGETVHNKEGLVSWGYLYFENEGDYTYEVSEVNDGQDGVTYDPKKYTVTFHVTEDETKGDTYSRPLKTEIEVSPGGEIAFNNTVKTGVAFEIPVEKRFVNQPENFDGSFTYKLEPDTQTKLKEGYELPGEASLSVSVKPGEPISFGEISFTEPGSYGFTISEDSSEALENIVYDESVWTVTVTVANGESGLEITDVDYDDSKPDEGTDTAYADMLKDLEQKKEEAEAQRELNKDSAEFINTYTPPEWQYRKAVFINTYLKPAVYAPKVDKAFESNVITPVTPFTFTLTPTGESPEEGLVMPEQTTVVISGSGIKNFDNVTFRKAGTYHFIIQETQGAVPGVGYDKQAFNLTVEVTDPKNDGNLEISSVNYEKAALAFAPVFQPLSFFNL